MNKKNRFAFVFLALLAGALLFGGCTEEQPAESETGSEAASESETEETVNPSYTENGGYTFGYYLKTGTFDAVPAYETKDGFLTSVPNCNYDCDMIDVDYTTKEEYDAYLLKLESEGFTRYADSGEHGINDDVYSAAFTRDGLTVYVIHQALQSKSYVIAGTKETLSEHLIDSDSYRENLVEGLPTSLTLLDSAHAQSMGMIIQLKNGHFLVVDGGYTTQEDAVNLVEYLEKMNPNGGKPIVEGWFLTHAHGDHYGVLYMLSHDDALAGRILVNGFYFNKPNLKWASMNGSVMATSTTLQWLCMTMKNESGGSPVIYRPVFGQRYYFCDTTIDIVCTTEMVPYINSTTDLNESSTSFILNTEGQKAYIQGDAETGCQRFVISSFRRDYLDLDIYQVSHHGYNTIKVFVDYVKRFGTCIDPSHFLVDSVAESGATPYLIEHSDEFYYQGKGNGTLRMDFPYHVGEMKTLGYDFELYPTWKEIIVPNNYGLYIEG